MQKIMQKTERQFSLFDFMSWMLQGRSFKSQYNSINQLILAAKDI